MDLKALIKSMLLEIMVDEALEERESPLSDKEEHLAKRMKPALASFKKQYGAEKGKEYFYGKIRNMAKEGKLK